MSFSQTAAKRQGYFVTKGTSSDKRVLGVEDGEGSRISVNNLEEEQNTLLRVDNRRQFQKRDSKDGLQEKLRKAEEMAQKYKSEVASLEFNLNFYKQKLQEEVQESAGLEEEIEDVNKALMKCVLRVYQLIDQGDQSAVSVSLTEDESSVGLQLEQVWLILKKLNLGLNNLEGSLFSQIRKKEEENKIIIDSLRNQLDETQTKTNLGLKELENYKNKFGLEKKNLELKIKSLMEQHESKETEVEDRKQEVEKIFEQRELNRALLVSSEKERMGLFNDIYKIGKSKYDVDFQEMTKAQVSKFCLMLFSKIEDLEEGKKKLEIYTEKMECNARAKYESLLRVVKDYERNKAQPSKLKRMDSLPTS